MRLNIYVKNMNNQIDLVRWTEKGSEHVIGSNFTETQKETKKKSSIIAQK